MAVHLIWARSRAGVIGAGGGIPWRLPEDLRRFKALTHGSTVLMGRRTWDSLPAATRPLPGRRNLVLTRDPQWSAPGAEPVASLDEVPAQGDLWVIGGAEIYRLALPLAEDAHVTEVDVDVPGDTFAPDLGAGWRLSAGDPARGWHTSTSGLRYRHLTYERGEPGDRGTPGTPGSPVAHTA